MQCGPIRYTAAQTTAESKVLVVLPRSVSSTLAVPDNAGIQDVFGALIQDAQRNAAVVADVIAAYQEGRKVLVLTERAEHIKLLQQAFAEQIAQLFVLHGRMTRKQRNALVDELNALDGHCPRVLLATGKLVGDGFDHPPLDTLVLAMPISWKGTLQQYAGRLHRDHEGKTDIRIYDYVDSGPAALLRMWEKRQRGYKAMGYQLG